MYNLKSGGPLHLGDADTPPSGFNWDAWLGVAPERPYHQNIFKKGWHFFWDFSGGDMANDGIHQIDLAMMLMGNPGMPSAASCTAGRLQYKGDDAEVPDVQVASFDFDDFVMTFEQTGYPRYMQKTTGTIRRKRHKKVLDAVKGHRLSRSRHYKAAKEDMLHAGAGWQQAAELPASRSPPQLVDHRACEFADRLPAETVGCGFLRCRD